MSAKPVLPWDSSETYIKNHPKTLSLGWCPGFRMLKIKQKNPPRCVLWSQAFEKPNIKKKKNLYTYGLVGAGTAHRLDTFATTLARPESLWGVFADINKGLLSLHSALSSFLEGSHMFQYLT